MVVAVVDKKNNAGEPAYTRSIRRLADPAQAEAVIGNGVIFNPSSVMVLKRAGDLSGEVDWTFSEW